MTVAKKVKHFLLKSLIITSLIRTNEIASNGCNFVKVKFFEDYRKANADKPPSKYQFREQEVSPTIDLNPFYPTIHRYHTAHLRGRHSVVEYENETDHVQMKYWTLPKSTSTADADRPNIINQKTLHSPKSVSEVLKFDNQPTFVTQAEQSIKISPIDPRTTATFKSSTPTNKENIVNLSSKLLSPVKSTMTNEELYAVIHKSKKKLNIKETPERADSPSLNTINLSPVISETSSLHKTNQRYPETGYLGEGKNRSSLNLDKQNIRPYSLGTYNPQKQETCADRYGPRQQTSRLDFKKLLLQHSVKLNTLNVQSKSNKLSAVEQLKLSKEKPQIPSTPPGNRSQINILDLSGSPKTYSHRKVVKSSNQPLSPGRSNSLLKDHKNTPKILLSPKSQWRFASPRSDVLSTPIPEANNEDENSNSSGEKSEIPLINPPSKTVPIVTNHHFGARRSLIPINEHNLNEEFHLSTSINQGVFPIDNDYSNSHSLSRAEIMQAKRAEFFKNSPESSLPTLTSFKSPNSSTIPKSNTSPDREKTSPSTLETAL
ncbi:unnamed protein product [Euphydryas editha]|uniref:Uncharacterized protein n=1 Tax=Euphydryas editha TaxID=104508 RepID=A0AAU9V6Z7_EUPED|nr:unnamed protein product [Euphydryas editha]